MKTFEITFPNGERKIVEATYYVEKSEAGTKVLELYKTVSNYSSESKPYLFITGYEDVKEVVEVDAKRINEIIKEDGYLIGIDNVFYEYVKDCCNSCGNGQECESKE